MTLATSAAWSVPGGSSVMPATEMSPHGLLIAPARVQLASVRSLGVVARREPRRLVGSSWVTGAPPRPPATPEGTAFAVRAAVVVVRAAVAVGAGAVATEETAPPVLEGRGPRRLEPK